MNLDEIIGNIPAVQELIEKNRKDNDKLFQIAMNDFSAEAERFHGKARGTLYAIEFDHESMKWVFRFG
tara:strand:- start:623 stop:826 length:204 start_codon:yes stop_codon:yes gene_type:complete